jgi:predicted enzyme related to lactoylglutathione lyase
MTNINGVLARVFVPDLDAAIPLYTELAGATDVARFTFRDVQLARIGPFLLLAGNTAAYRDRVATILVSRLAPVLEAIENAGGEIVEGPSPAPNGTRLIARHPDGSVFEYIEASHEDLGLPDARIELRRRGAGDLVWEPTSSGPICPGLADRLKSPQTGHSRGQFHDRGP